MSEYIEVEIRSDQMLPSILADPDQLKQAFGNIIRNAGQAMGERGRLEITTNPTDTSIVVAFTDTGEGISSENLPSVFQPLFTTKARGIGLGLPLSKMLIEGHGGRIEVESKAGQGSTFIVSLPLSGGQPPGE
jgi:signal transduction histidine kinase